MHGGFYLPTGLIFWFTVFQPHMASLCSSNTTLLYAVGSPLIWLLLPDQPSLPPIQPQPGQLSLNPSDLCKSDSVKVVALPDFPV